MFVPNDPRAVRYSDSEEPYMFLAESITPDQSPWWSCIVTGGLSLALLGILIGLFLYAGYVAIRILKGIVTTIVCVWKR